MKYPIEVQRKVQCAKHGHPPVVNVCFGQVTCVRCDEVLGDTLMGSFDLMGYAIMGHDCDTCFDVLANMTEHDKKLLPFTFL